MTTEISLYGELRNERFKAFTASIIGLTGDTGKDWCSHEVNFRPKYETPFGPARNDDVALSLKSMVFEEKDENNDDEGEDDDEEDDEEDDQVVTRDHQKRIIAWQDRQWHLIQRNQPEPPKHKMKLANRRVVNTCPITTTSGSNPFQFLEDLGYAFSFEFLCQGYIYRLKNIQIKCYRVYKFPEKFKLHLAEPLSSLSNSWIVETCIQDSPPELINAHSAALFSLAFQLAGSVDIGLVDHVKLQSKFMYK